MSAEAVSAPAAPAAKPVGLVEFVRFVATGSIAAISNLAAVWAFQQVSPYPVAVVLGYLVGMVIAFILFQRIMFRNPGQPLLRRIFRFTVVNLVGLLLCWLVTMAMFHYLLPAIRWTFMPDRIANFFGVAVPAFTSYFGHKFYTYR